MQERASANARWPLWLLPLAVTCLSFASGLGGGFVLDDRPAILENGAVNGELGLSAIWTRTFWGTPLDVPPPIWRPLASLFFRVELLAFGRTPFGFHLVSLLLYAVGVHLGQRLLRTSLSAGAACAAACIFAAMPLHVENVSSAVGQADLLAFGLGLGALLAVQPLLSGGKTPASRTVLACALYLLALLCKESALLLFVVVFSWAAFVKGDAEAPPSKRFAPAAALAVIALSYLGVRMALVPATLDTSRVADDVLAGATAWQRVQFALRLVGEYSRLVLAPIDLCTGRKYAEVSLPYDLGMVGLAGLALVLFAAWRTWHDARARRAPFLLAAAIMWFIFSSLVVSAPEAMADRFMLYPTFFCVAAGVRASLALPIRPKLLVVVATAVVVTQGALSAAYARAWRTDVSLLATSVAACPDSVHNHYRYAHVLSAEGDPQRAAWHFAVAASARDAFPRPWHHPAAAEENMLPGEELVRGMHALLHIDAPEGPWRAWLAAALRAQGMTAEAHAVDTLRPGAP